MKARATNIALALGVSLLTLGSLEGLCRWWESRHPPAAVAEYLWNWQQKWDGDFYVMDSDAVGWPPWEDFSADGVRDRRHAMDKPEGVRRVVFLGDSVTLGDHIRAEEAFPQQMGARFDRENRPVEVFNVSLLGWSTRQERIAYGRIARKYRPDDVVLAVCLNDIAELQNNLDKPPRWLAALHRRSALVRVVVNARGREIGSVEELFTRGDSAKVRQAMARFFAEARTLRDEVQKDGARLTMIVFPFRFQVEPGAPEPRVQREIAAFAAAEKMPFLDLLPVLGPMGDAAFVDYDHLSAAGARRTADAILEAGLLPLPQPAPVVADDAALIDTLRHDAGESARLLAAQTLGKRHAVAAAGALFDALGDPRTAVRWAAAFALYEIQPPLEVALPRLMAAIDSPDDYVRAFACWTLGNIGEPAAPAVAALTRALARPGAYAQGGAALALGKIGAASAPAVPALTEALGSSDNRVQRMAARALGRIGPPASAAVPALLRAVSDKDDEYLRGIAVRAVGRIAPTRPEVVQAMQAATRDGNPEVRRQAELALRGRER